MKALAGFALVGIVFFFALGSAHAQEAVGYTVLSPEDVKIYGEIFQAEKTGQIAKADALTHHLSDDVLVGYVLEERYLGPHAHATLKQLKSWLEKYADLPGADRIYKLAAHRAPKKAHLPAPQPVRWRGATGEGDAFADSTLESPQARSIAAQLQKLERDGKPEAAQAALKKSSLSATLPQADFDRLETQIAQYYLAQAKDETALELAEAAIARGSSSVAQEHWVGGLASYRLGKFENAARHFESVSDANGNAAQTHARAAFWAARSWMRAGMPERVLALYRRAATEPNTFYGLLAARLLGRDTTLNFVEPALDTVSFAGLMLDKPAHRAAALWQIGHRETLEIELTRAFGEISPDLDPAFAALAHKLGVPSLELRAAETSSQRDIRLTSLYPVPPYQPKNGYDLDQALVLAFAKQESRFAPSALSKSGARGVMQIMPATAAAITHDRTLAGANKSRLDDPQYSMTLGQDYLRGILDRQMGNLVGLAAAYNAGEGNLMKWMSLHDDISDPLLFIESVPVTETRDYIKRVIMNMWMYRARFGQSADGLDDAASGAWPVYKEAGMEASTLPAPH